VEYPCPVSLDAIGGEGFKIQDTQWCLWTEQIVSKGEMSQVSSYLVVCDDEIDDVLKKGLARKLQVWAAIWIAGRSCTGLGHFQLHFQK
jgi:hypothetical protein